MLELLPTHQSLGAYVRSFRPPEFPIAIWRTLGCRLGAVHAALRDSARTDPSLRRSPPWASLAHKPAPHSLVTLSPAGVRVLHIVQGSTAITRGLETVGELWAPQTVIHGDIRADNILLRAAGGAAHDIRIVDWELHQLGDSAWDLAGLVAALVLFWVNGLVPESDGAASSPDAALPWPVFQATGRALWSGYLRRLRR